MRSLWSGVTGLNAHQIAMDVEGNNIANVNTNGFKYSRANFSDLLSQTSKIATAPQGKMGGKNPMQVGLGTEINSVTRIFSQGSIQTTSKNTDLAIQGNGFFIVSSDEGKTYKYTRSGDFVFDANGNFVNNQGLIAQGWVRDPVTGEIDNTAPIQGITIPPGLTTPAKETSVLNLKANLNSGDEIVNKSVIRPLDSTDGTKGADGVTGTKDDEKVDKFDVLFNSEGKAFNFKDGQGIKVAFNDGLDTKFFRFTTGETNSVGWSNDSVVVEQEKLSFDGEMTAGKINVTVNGIKNETISVDYNTDHKTTMADLATKLKASSNISDAVYTPATQQSITYTMSRSVDTGDTLSITINGNTYTQAYDTDDATTYDKLKTQIENGEGLHVTIQNADDGTDDNDEIIITGKQDGSSFTINSKLANDDGSGGGAVTVSESNIVNPVPDKLEITGLDTGESISLKFDTSSATGLNEITSKEIVSGVGQTYYFNNTEDLRKGLQDAAKKISPTAEVIVNSEGKYQIKNSDSSGEDINISVEGISDSKTDENLLFTTTMRSMAGELTAGSSGIKISQAINAATHASSIDIFDSLGTKHTVRLEFRKEGYIKDTSGTKVGVQWHMTIKVPEPGDIGGSPVKNIVEGAVVFGSDGTLSTFTPTSITFTANNGSAPNQTIQLDLGTPNKFDGLTSFDNPSNTSGISQDGFTGGDLDGIRIDQTGTLIGSFTNGRSFGLAQLAMAKFTNNIGLESDGGNLFVQTANSGDPVIGQAASGGRGFIQSSSLEMSNVDLSRSLTQLIVIQRGFQANSKTITTSDQMLNTLLQLKQ
jgi:flagellar hook protein FlgE